MSLQDGSDTEYISTSLSSTTPKTGQIFLSSSNILPFNTEDENAPPLSWKGFQQHLDLLHLPNSFVYNEKMQTPPSWFDVPLEGGLKGFILQPERWDSNLANFSLSVAYSPTSRVTNVVAHMLHKVDVEHLLLRLQALKSIAWHPLLVPLILVEKRIDGNSEQLTLIRNSLHAVEKRTGTHKNYHVKKRHQELQYYAYGNKVWEQRSVEDVEFETAPGILISIVSDCVMFEAKCLINENLLDWILGLNEALCESGTNGEFRAVSANSIRTKISNMKTWCYNNRIRSVYLGKRAEAQMQACLNLIAQRDNALNLKKTEAAIRDSSDMRAIAWVTLAFFPATFVAVQLPVSYNVDKT
ncbi:hypothetical protein BGZ63DRAFT_429268 [Mariannaea sp. PMI_226]|nr:hypothetical protein BGZ63DRAFT_429268 [Mariannaea sp. PMI_226]